MSETMTVQRLLDYANNPSNKPYIRRDVDGNLTLLKYSKKTFFEGKWTPEVCEMRGIVIDTDTNTIVSYPFTKFFNFDEPLAQKFEKDEVLDALIKHNGFLAVVSKYKGKLVVSTQGSLNGDYVPLIKDYINEDLFLSVLKEGYTYMFECINPTDAHVTIETAGLHLLAIRKNELGSPIIHDFKTLFEVAKQLHVETPEHFVGTLDELRDRDLLLAMDIEGLVVYASDGRMAKVKSPKFLGKRFLSYMTDNKIEALSPNTIAESDEEVQSALLWVYNHKENYKTYQHPLRVAFVRWWFSVAPTAFILVGLPYSGKSTLIRNTDFLRNLPCVSMDNEVDALCYQKGLTYNSGFKVVAKEAEQRVKTLLNVILNNRQSFVWDATNLTEKSRAEKLARLESEGYQVIAIEMPELSETEEATRILQRLDKVIDDNVLEDMRARYVHVQAKEGFDLIVKLEKETE